MLVSVPCGTAEEREARVAVENLSHLEAHYALALEHEDYRSACWIAIRAIHRIGKTELWLLRLRGCLKRRAHAY
jgi:hypothetical protein